MSVPYIWTPDRVALLRKLYVEQALPCDTVADRLGVSPKAVDSAVRKQGFGRGQRGALWTAEQTAFVAEQWTAGLSSNRLAEITGRPRGSIMGKIYRLGLFRRRLEPTIARPTFTPPRPGMVRLAEFDPVIARALAQRLAEAA